jgi:hypothetical protein
MQERLLAPYTPMRLTSRTLSMNFIHHILQKEELTRPEDEVSVHEPRRHKDTYQFQQARDNGNRVQGIDDTIGNVQAYKCSHCETDGCWLLFRFLPLLLEVGDNLLGLLVELLSRVGCAASLYKGGLIL